MPTYITIMPIKTIYLYLEENHCTCKKIKEKKKEEI